MDLSVLAVETVLLLERNILVNINGQVCKYIGV